MTGNGIDLDEAVVPPGVPEQCRSCWVALMRLNSEITKVEAKQGRIYIPAAGWVGIVSIVLMLIGSIITFGIRLGEIETTVRNVAISQAKLSGVVESHVQAVGHIGSVERITAVKEQLDKHVANSGGKQ